MKGKSDRRRWVALWLGLGCGLVPGWASAQEPPSRLLSGSVQDARTGESLPYATVQLLAPAGALLTGTAADERGRFRLSLTDGLEPNGLRLIVSTVGYLPDTTWLRGASAPTGLRIRLQDRTLELPGVTVEARRYAERQTSRAGTTRLTARDIEETPVVGETDVLRTLQRVPGVSFTSDYNVRPYLRGSTGDQTAFRLNGAALYNPYHLFGLFGTVDADIVSTLVVDRGVLPVEEDGRLGGLIRIETRDGTEDRLAGRAQVSLISAKMSLEGPIHAPGLRPDDRLSYLVSGRRTYLDLLVGLLVHGEDNPLPYHFTEGYGQLVWRRADRAQRLHLFGYSSLDALTPKVEPGNETLFGSNQWANTAAGAAYRRDWTEQGELAARLTYSHYSNHLDRLWSGRLVNPEAGATGPDSYRQRIDNQVDDLLLRATATRPVGEGTSLLVGAEQQLLRVGYDATNLLGQAYEKQTEPLGMTGVFASLSRANLSLGGGSLSLDGGVRLSVFSPNAAPVAISPRLNARWLLSESWSATAAVGWQTQVLTTLNDEDDVLTLFEAWALLPGRAVPERARQVTLGASWSPTQRPVGLSLDLYHKRLSHLSKPNRFRATTADPLDLSGDGWAYGAELSGRWQPTAALHLDASYTWAKAIYGFDVLPYPITPGATYRQERYYPRFDQRHAANLLLNWRTGGWNLSAQFTLKTGLPTTEGAWLYDSVLYDNPPGDGASQTGSDNGGWRVVLDGKNSDRLPVSHRLDLGATRTFVHRGWSWAIFMSIYNVYNRRNAFAAVPPGRRFEFKSVRGVPNLPILPTLGVSTAF